jgi:hypothetical protein
VVVAVYDETKVGARMENLDAGKEGGILSVVGGAPRAI